MSKKQEQDSDRQPLEQQIVELTEALQRERADVTNVRRQHEEKMAALRNIVKAQVVGELLPVIDNFERALKHAPTPSQDDQQLVDWIEGVKKVVDQFEKTFEKMGVQRIKTVGEAFDPHFHEAVSVEEGEGAEEVVSEELQSGFILGEEVIRPAMVRVSRALK